MRRWLETGRAGLEWRGWALRAVIVATAGALLLGLAIAGSAALPSADAVAQERDGGWESEELGCRLGTRGDWTTERVSVARKFARDVQLCVSTPSGMFGLVCVGEHSGPADREAVAKQLVASLPLVDRETASFEEAQLGGAPAVGYSVSGKVNGTQYGYLGRVAIRGGRFYHVLAVAEDWLNELEADDFLSRFEFVGGSDASAEQHPDAVGIGWRVRDGVFEDVLGRLRVRPPEGWQLLTGDEAREIGADTTVGLVHPESSSALQVIAERAGGARLKPIVELVEAGMRDWLGAGSEVPGGLEVGGVQGKYFRAQVSEPEPHAFHAVVVPHRTHCYQFIAWHPPGKEDETPVEIVHALAAFEFLSASTIPGLRQELAEAAPHETYLDRAHLVRGRTYSNFDHGFTWTAPSPFWRIDAGHQAARTNPAAALIGEDLENGTYLQVVLEAREEMDHADYHAAVLTNVLGADVGTPRALPRGDASLLWTAATDDERSVRWEIVTGSTTDSLFQILIWQAAGEDRATRAAADAIVKNLSVDTSMQPFTVSGRTLTQHRLLWSFAAPSDGWNHAVVTPEHARIQGSAHEWSLGDRRVRVAACIPHESGLLETMHNMMGVGMRVELGLPLRPTEDAEEIELAGWPAQHVEIDVDGERRHLISFTTDHAGYHIIVVDDPGATEPLLDHLLRSFRLL